MKEGFFSVKYLLCVGYGVVLFILFYFYRDIKRLGRVIIIYRCGS